MYFNRPSDQKDPKKKRCNVKEDICMLFSGTLDKGRNQVEADASNICEGSRGYDITWRSQRIRNTQKLVHTLL